MAWQRAASVAEVAEDKGLQVNVGGADVALFRVGESIYALEAVCPHAEGYLAEGFIEDGLVECPLHEAKFEIKTGKCLCAPADRDLITYPVKVEGNDVLVDV